MTITNRTSAQVRVVVRGGVEPPTFRSDLASGDHATHYYRQVLYSTLVATRRGMGADRHRLQTGRARPD